jgi:hypothetical protein
LLWLCLFSAFCGPTMLGLLISLTMRRQPKQFRGFEVIVVEVKDKLRQGI